MFPLDRHAECLLGCLLSLPRASLPPLPEEEWKDFLSLAQKNVVLLRTAEILIDPFSPAFQEAVHAEKKRIKEVLSLIQRLGTLCEEAQIPYIFTKAFQHFPDMGHDIDLLVADRSRTIDRLLQERMGARRIESSCLNRISGKTNLEIPGFATLIEIHHGLIGHMGEHQTFAKQMIFRRVQQKFDEVETFVPSPEDQFLLQVLQRLYGHFYFRLSDLIKSRQLMTLPLEWNYIRLTAHKIGIEQGLELFLKYLQQPLLRFEGWVYPVPFPAILKIYGWKWLSDVRARRWTSFFRLLLLPVAAGWMTLRKAARLCKLKRYPP